MNRLRTNFINHNTGGEQSTRAPYRLTVSELDYVVLTRQGRIERTLDVGVHWLRPWTDQITVISALPQNLNVLGQETLTSDGATIRASVVVVLTVMDPIEVVRCGQSLEQLYLAVQLGLRNAIGSRALAEALTDREAISSEVLAAVGDEASRAGRSIETLALRDFMVPGELRRAVAEVVTARLSGQAALQRARSESAALRSLANTARLVRDNPELLQLRLIQQMETSKGNTYVIGGGPALLA